MRCCFSLSLYRDVCDVVPSTSPRETPKKPVHWIEYVVYYRCLHMNNIACHVFVVRMVCWSVLCVSPLRIGDFTLNSYRVLVYSTTKCTCTRAQHSKVCNSGGSDFYSRRKRREQNVAACLLDVRLLVACALRTF